MWRAYRSQNSDLESLGLSPLLSIHDLVSSIHDSSCLMAVECINFGPWLWEGDKYLNVICIAVVLDSVLLKKILDRGKVQRENERSANRSLCGTPKVSGVGSDVVSLTCTYCERPVRYYLNHCSASPATPEDLSLWIALRFLKSSSIHPICINVWRNFSFNKVTVARQHNSLLLWLFILSLLVEWALPPPPPPRPMAEVFVSIWPCCSGFLTLSVFEESKTGLEKEIDYCLGLILIRQ